MKQLNDDKQMTDVWRLPAIAPWEKACGKHPTQKPLALLTRIILASTDKNAWVLEREKEFVEISQKRREEIEDLKVYSQFRKKIKDIAKSETLMPSLFACEEEPIIDLPF